MANILETIATDLEAGASFLEKEAEDAAHWVWNIVKGVFIALAPDEITLLKDVLLKAIQAAGTGASIEQVEQAALQMATDGERAILAKASSGIIQTVIAGLRAAQPVLAAADAAASQAQSG